MVGTTLAALPPLVTPSSYDLLGLLPELILGGAFVLLMVLDVFLPAARRNWLAVFAFVALAAAFGATMWGWFDAGSGRALYYGSFAYDRFSMFVNAILLISAALVVIISPQYLNRRGIHHGEYYALILAATTGMMILAGAMNLMVIFLGIELLSISLYVLSGFSRGEERSQEAAMKYLLLGGFASGFLLYGMALVYGETGHTQLVQIGLALRAAQNVDPLVLVGVILVFIGFAFKTSSAPFHAWTPDVYQGAPTSVTMFMSVATKVAAFAALVRVFTYTFPQVYTHWQVIVVAGRDPVDAGGQHRRADADQPQAHARLLGHRPGRVHPDRRRGETDRSAGHHQRALLPRCVRGHEHRRFCGDHGDGRPRRGPG